MMQPQKELDVVAAFRHQLADLPDPPRRSRRAPVVAATAAVVACLLVVLPPIGRGPTAALAVTRDDDSLELRVIDAAADSQQMTRELNAAGVRGRVLLVPVAVEDVGRWVLIAEFAGRTASCATPADGRGAEETVRLGRIENAGEALRVPTAELRESSGSFALVAGRAARPGESVIDTDTPASVERMMQDRALTPAATSLPACGAADESKP